MQVRDFAREEIPRAIAKWLESIADKDPTELMDEFYSCQDVSEVLRDVAYWIRSGLWLKDIEGNAEWK